MTELDGRIAQLSPQRQQLLRRRVSAAQTARLAANRIPRADRSGPLPLSYAQQRLWFLDQLTPGLPTYKSPWVLRLFDSIDVDRLQQALTRLVGRHEVLRTRYLAEDGLPYQVIDPPPELLPLTVVDLSGVPEAEREEAMLQRVLAQARQPVDLAAGPATRALLYRLAAADWVLMLDMHHMCSDGWSIGILAREVLTAYQGGELPELPIQYADFVAWQRGRLEGGELTRQLGYWAERLADLPVLDFPTDRPRPANRTWAGGTLLTTLPASLRESVDQLSRQQGLPPLPVWLAGLQALMSRYTGQEDIVLGSVFSGRTRTELEPLVGFFANTLVLRTNTGGNPTFRELLARAQETLLGAHEHQDVPFDKVVEALRPDRDPGRNPLFQICLIYQGNALVPPQGSVRAETVQISLGTSRFDLAIYLSVLADGQVSLSFEYSTELFDEARIRAFAVHYGQLMAAVVADPDRRIHDVDLMSPAERHTELVAWNDTAMTYGTAGRCLHELFEAQVARSPEHPAVRFAGQEWTYRQLDARAGAIAGALRAAGAGPEERVGVLLDRSLELPAALLGVLKSGAAYLPLDPTHPVSRTALLLADAGCRLVVTTAALAGSLPAGVTPILVDAAGSGPVEHQSHPASTPDNLAYVIYTSGSTGRPKGVMVSHANAVDYVCGAGVMFGLTPADRLLQFANPCFDVSVFDIFGALCHGATLVLAPRDTLVDPVALAAFLRAERVTVAAIAPAMLAVLDPAGLIELRAVCAAGEAFPGEVVNRWRTDGRVFHNGYGPTEVTVICVDHVCGPQAPGQRPPIGRPTPNHRAYVLDRWGQPVPPGIPGELCVGGAGVARGYLDRPGLTARQFVPDPFGPPGGRLYRTGDVVRWNHDGTLDFLGRRDDQVKIRGFRVEPGEATAALATCAGISAAVVVARDDGAGPQLVGYFVADGTAPTVDEIRAHLGAILPPYLVPSAFVALDALPLTPSGKIDRRALPAPAQSRPDLAAEYQAPRNDTEARLAELWTGVLGLERIGVQDNFFTLGGNSLQATQLVSRIRAAFGVELDLRTFFGNPTIAALAALADAQPVLSEQETLDVLAELGELTDEEVLALLAEEDGASGDGGTGTGQAPV